MSAGRLFVALLAAIAGTYLFLPIPPYQDLGAHAAMLAMRMRLPESAFLQQYLQRGSVLGPYTTFLGLNHLLGPLVGPEVALRIGGALANVAWPVAALVARRRILKDPWTGAGFVVLAVSLGFMTAQGFTSFLFGLAAFTLAFAAWINLLVSAGGDQAPVRSKEVIAVLVLGLATAVTHGFAFILLMFCAGVSALAARAWRRSLRSRVLLGAGALLPGLLFLGAVYLRDRGLYPPDVNDTLIGLRTVPGKAQAMFLPTVFSKLGVDAAVCAVLWLVLGVAAARVLRRPAGGASATELRRAVMMRTAIVLFVLALVSPARLDFFGSVDIRLACTALLLGALAAPPGFGHGRIAAILARAPAPAAVVMVAFLWVVALLFQREARATDEILARVPTHARLLYLPVHPFSRFWAASPYMHIEKRLLWQRDVLVSNVWLHPGSALRPTAAGLPYLTATPANSDDGQVPWTRYDIRPWDYVLTRTSDTATPPPVPASLELVATADRLRLYRNRAADPLPNPPPEGEGKQLQ